LHENSLAEYEALGGAAYPERVKELLSGLGLPEADFAKLIGVLSGGQKKLIGLARLLLLRPDVLLLDEPDNHLDLPGKAYLETLIRSYAGGVVLVSHDRYLLDAVVNQIVEIEDGRLTSFSGNYTEYILDKQERLARAEELYHIQQRSIARMEMALKRYQLWVQVSDKFASRVRSMQTRLEKVKHMDRPVLERRRMGLELSGWRGSNQVLEFMGVQKSYARPLLNGVTFLIRHGERVGLIGPNGSGKSVLLRLILGSESPDAGEIRIGPSIQTGYYAQEHETLDLNKTLLETVRWAGNLSESSAVAFLLRYLFTYKPAILNLKLRHFCLALGQAVSGAWRYIRKWREMGTPVEREPAILLGSKPDEIATGPGSQGSNRIGDFVTQKARKPGVFRVWIRSSFGQACGRSLFQLLSSGMDSSSLAIMKSNKCSQLSKYI
jgi:ATP-binding cassette subfamily F protein 3